MTGAYFLLNALWLILNFALQLTITDIAISIYINGTVISVCIVLSLFYSYKLSNAESEYHYNLKSLLEWFTPKAEIDRLNLS